MKAQLIVCTTVENYLKIKLTEKVETNNSPQFSPSGKALTMGDLLKQAMDKD